MSEDLRDDSEDNGENVASDDAVSKHSEQRDSQSPATSSSSIASDLPPERRVTRQRGGTKMVCAVLCCDSSSESDASLRFFQMPSGNQMKRRSSWIHAVPELENAISAHYRNVCSRHFVDGEPTPDNPAPTLLLTKDTPKPVTRKRKSLAMENDEAKRKVKEEVKEEPIEEEEETVNDASSLKASAKSKGSTPTSNTPKVINFRTLSGKPVSSYSSSSVLRVAGEDGKTKFVRVIKKTGPPSTATDTLSTAPPHMTEGDNEGIATGPTLSSILAPILNNTSSNNTDVGNSRTPLFQPISGRASLPVSDEGCTHCLTAVPKVRRDLGRVEARLDAMVGMVKALLQQQSVRHVHVVSASNGNSVACRIPSSTPLRVQSVARAAAGGDSGSGTGSARVSFAPLAPGGVKPGSVKPVSTASPSASMRFVTASSLKAPGNTPSSSSATATVTIKEKPLSLSGILPTPTSLLPAVVALNTRVARTILMMRGSTFTLHFARHNGPGLSQVSDKALVDCVKMLEEDGLINLDPTSRGKPYLDPSTTFRKALSPSEESLDKYGLTLAQYKSILVRPKVTVFKKAT